MSENEKPQDPTELQPDSTAQPQPDSTTQPQPPEPEEPEALDSRQIAMVAHQANQAYCKVLGDKSQPNWVDAPDWQQQSVILGVENIMANPALSPSQSHQLWLEHKVREGWKYGPTKDTEAKTHPCCRPFDELPQEFQVKDILFGAIVRCLMPGYPGDMARPVPGPHQVKELPDTECASGCVPPDAYCNDDSCPVCNPPPEEPEEFLGDPPKDRDAPPEMEDPKKPECGPGGGGDPTCCPS